MGLFSSDEPVSDTYEPCPECGNEEYIEQGLFRPDLECTQCGYVGEWSELKFGDTARETVNENFARNQSISRTEELEALADQMVNRAKGNSVTKNKLLFEIDRRNNRAVINFIDEDEQPEYIVVGKTIDVEDGGDNSSLFLDDRSRKFSIGPNRCYTVITNRRIFCISQQFTGNDERNIEYSPISGVDIDTGIFNRRLTVRTPGQVYHIDVSHSSEEECREAMNYIRKRRSSSHTQTATSSNPTGDKIDQLDKLRQLRESGDLTEEEFDSLKSELLS